MFGTKINEIMSVMEGNTVTLHTDTDFEKHEDDILWTFGAEKSQISLIKRKKQVFSVFNDVLDERFRDRLKLDKQTGSLTITNTTTKHAGHYHLDISGEHLK